jgi:hypothetical protein
MIIVPLILSAVFLCIVNAVALREGGGVGRATLWSFLGIFALFACTMTLFLPLNALAVALAGAVCCVVKARPRWFLASSLVVTGAVYGFVGLPTLLAWGELKKEYPLESLADRLAYEDRPRMATPTVGRPAETLSRAKRLADLEEQVRLDRWQHGGEMRVRSLERLHAGVVRQFIDSPGFGVSRMVRQPAPWHLERDHEKQGEGSPEKDTIPQPDPVYSSLEPTPVDAKPATEPDLLSAHDSATVDFVNPGGFGYIRSREQVAGFLSHRFSHLPQPPERWRVARVELVSLLKHETPGVYVSDNLPRMDELRQAPTRLLDEFEKKALDGLLGGEDLMVQRTPRQMRLLGSIRAVKQCLRCHGVERGELLGVFSYQLSPQ